MTAQATVGGPTITELRRGEPGAVLWAPPRGGAPA